MTNRNIQLFAAIVFLGLIFPVQTATAAPPILCAQENSSCTLTGGELRDAYYGANGKFSHRVVNSTFSCKNEFFGDPAPGLTKQCFVGDANYTYRYPEWENPNPNYPTIFMSDPAVVAFGNLQVGSFFSSRVLGKANCDKYSFGDPAYGYTKSCYVSPTFRVCATENGTCAVSGLTLVAYGPPDGPYAYKAVSGSVACNNATFGDPARGYTKTCFVKP